MTDIPLIREMQAELNRLHFALGLLTSSICQDDATRDTIAQRLTEKKQRATHPDHIEWAQSIITALNATDPITTATQPKKPALRLVTETSTPTAPAADLAADSDGHGANDTRPENDNEH